MRSLGSGRGGLAYAAAVCVLQWTLGALPAEAQTHPTGGGGPIPASNADLDAIRSTAESYSALAAACKQKLCPETDCARANQALQALADLEANLQAMVGHLEAAGKDHLAHYKSLADQGILTNEQMDKTIMALAIQKFLHDLGSMLLDLASVGSTVKDFLDDPSKLKDPAELIENLDKLYEAAKDAESFGNTGAGSLLGTEAQGAIGGLTPGAFGLEGDTINDLKSTASDLASIVKDVKEKGGDLKEALKKPGGPAAALGQILGTWLKAYNQKLMDERKDRLRELSENLTMSDMTQGASYQQLMASSRRRHAAEDALAAVTAAKQALMACLAKAGCSATMTRPTIPSFTQTVSGVTKTSWGKALDHFNSVLPGLHARLQPLPEIRDKVPCDGGPDEHLTTGGGGITWDDPSALGLDFDGALWCTWGGGTVPLLPGTTSGGSTWGPPLGPSILPPTGPGGLPSWPGGPMTTPGIGPQTLPKPKPTPTPTSTAPPGGPAVAAPTPKGGFPPTIAPTPKATPTPAPTTTPKAPSSTSTPPPAFKISFKATQKALEQGALVSKAMPGAQLSLNLFPEPGLPGTDQARDETTGADQAPLKVTTGPNGEAFLTFPPGVPTPFFGGPPPTLEIDATPQTGTIVGLPFDPSKPMDARLYFPGGLQGYVARTFRVDDTMFGVLQYPQYQAPVVQGLLDQIPGTLFVEENLCREIQSPPADPYFTSRSTWKQPYDDQWAIKRVGFTGLPGSAWERAAGGGPVVVAVIDTGLDWNHEDIPWDALWKNPGEVAGNGIDDDKNGFVDDTIGWDFWRNTNKPWDRNGHGTIVAGIIAARSGNGRGIAGVNPQARIMVLKALNTFGHTRASYIAEAIVYAADNGARVLNISVGGKLRTRTEQMALEYARKKGVLVVVASGNESASVANYGLAGLDGVLTVAATGFDDKRAKYSNWGAGIDIAAPGDDVLGPRARYTDLMVGIPGVEYRPGDAFVGSDRRYYRVSGTSFAAPIVAGAASLVWSRRPELTAEEVVRVLVHSARDVDVPGRDQYTGYGLLDVGAALARDPRFFVEAEISGVRVATAGGQTVVEVSGTADADRFRAARLEIGAGSSPQAWKPVGAPRTQPLRSGVLGAIPAQALAGAKEWTIRVIAEHADGTPREARFNLKLE